VASWQSFNYDAYTPPAPIDGGVLHVSVVPAEPTSDVIAQNFLGGCGLCGLEVGKLGSLGVAFGGFCLNSMIV